MVLIPLVVMRFDSTRKLVKEHKGEILPMMLQIGNRTPWKSPSSACSPARKTLSAQTLQIIATTILP